MVTTVKETTDRAKARKCFRFNDKNGFWTKFYKTNFQDESRREMYHYSVKCVEHGMRGFSPTFVATKKKFEKFRKVSEGLELKPVPEGFQSLSFKKKRETVEQLVDEFGDELAAAMSRGPVQGVDIQTDYSDNMQVGAGSARQFGMTVGEVVDMQVNNPVQIQFDEVWAAAPNPDLGNTLSNDTSLQNVAWNQCDNPEGRPPSRPLVQLELVVSIFNDLMHRAARFPGVLPKLVWSEAALRSFVNQLELLEGAFKDRSEPFLRSRQEELYAKLEDFSACEDVTSMPSLDESLADEIWSNLLTSPGRPEDPGTSPTLFTG